MQEIFGYCLIPETKAQMSFLFYGPGSTGKSTLLNVLIHMLNKENVSSVPMQNLSDRFRVADLFGKLANIVADLPTKGIEDTGIFKAIVSGDLIHAERKFQEAFSFRPFARLIFSCNNLPGSNDRTNGFYRRLIVIPFNNIVPEEKRDPHLENKLCQEADGILKWAFEGLNRLIKNDYKFSENESTKNLLEEYKKNNSNVLSFVEDVCEFDSEASESKAKVYFTYRHYCQNNGFRFLGKKKFNEELKSISGVSDGRSSTERFWKGIKLIDVF
jgi:putative DNA primase/helicase